MPDHHFYARYKLGSVSVPKHQPVRHQNQALNALTNWYGEAVRPAGGIVAIPTGGGKTFTAVRFLATNALSDGQKVLWLAHTHHLLEQAFEEFGEGAKLVANREELSVRTVSGAKDHWSPAEIDVDDDVLIGTIQTMRRAAKKDLKQFWDWIDGAGDQLTIVFDEAHHSPADSYRRFLFDLRERHPGIRILGLTATPTYTNEDKRGWLLEIFPQGILHQVSTSELMAESILAKPVYRDVETQYEPDFDPDEFARWMKAGRDLPSDIVESLAASAERNTSIASHYADNKDEYGPTIIFADRWYQCNAIEEALKKRGVRAGSMYSKVESRGSTADERNRRTQDTNSKVLHQFKDGELDVICNIRMLTEGTDVPHAKTVILTRKTTSRILLTQMVGRALRGPRFGGTDEAHIVSFVDDWKELIHWADAFELFGGLDDSTTEYGKRAPLELIRIDLVRNLVRQLDRGTNVNPLPYRDMLPTGWYVLEYQLGREDDQVEQIRELLVVFQDHSTGLTSFIQDLSAGVDAVVEEEALDPSASLTPAVEKLVDGWMAEYFPADQPSERLRRDVLAIARHMAQHPGRVPQWVPFEARDLHNLDKMAQDAIEGDWGPRKKMEFLNREFHQSDLFWRQLYPNLAMFKSAFDACMNRLLLLEFGDPVTEIVNHGSAEKPRDSEPSEKLKEQVRAKDGYRCVACGYREKRYLQVDHIRPFYRGGEHMIENLQTLCGRCNRLKGDTKRINFRDHVSDYFHNPPTRLELPKAPSGKEAKDMWRWENFVRRTINFFFGSSAVMVLHTAQAGAKFRHWKVELFAQNPADWLSVEDLGRLAATVREKRSEAGVTPVPESITVEGADGAVVRWELEAD